MKRDGDVGRREFSANQNSCNCTGWLPSGLADGRPWEFRGEKRKSRGSSPLSAGVYCVSSMASVYAPACQSHWWSGSWALEILVSLSAPRLGDSSSSFRLLLISGLRYLLTPWVSQPCLQHNQFPTLNPLCFKCLSMVSIFLVGCQLLYSRHPSQEFIFLT